MDDFTVLPGFPLWSRDLPLPSPDISQQHRRTHLSLFLTRTHRYAHTVTLGSSAAAATHPETTERPQKHPDLTHRLPSSTQTEDRSRRRRSQTELYWHHRGRISTTFFAWFKNKRTSRNWWPFFTVVPRCLRCCHTTRGKWAATGRTARSARCPLAADCRTQAPFSQRRRQKDPQSSGRSAEPKEVKTNSDAWHLQRMAELYTLRKNELVVWMAL